jgi:molybdate transport system substrate-binding protein
MKILLPVVKTAAALLTFLVSISAEAAEIRVIASPGLSTVFGVLGPQFERATGHTLAMQYGLLAAQKQQIEAGAFDVAIIPSSVLDDAIKQGKITAETRTPVARVSLGVGVRADTAKPDLTSLDAFKRTLLNAKSVSYVTDEPTGRHIAMGFERLGIADAMKAKTMSQETTARVWQAVASGEVELGFGFASNALSVRGVELAGPFPPELQYSVVMTAGVGVAARQADGAKALIRYLLAPEAAEVMKEKGMESTAP